MNEKERQNRKAIRSKRQRRFVLFCGINFTFTFGLLMVLADFILRFLINDFTLSFLNLDFFGTTIFFLILSFIIGYLSGFKTWNRREKEFVQG